MSEGTIKRLLLIFLLAASVAADARPKHKQDAPVEGGDIRVMIAADITGAELKRHPVKYTNDGMIALRGRKYSGRIEFYENGNGTLTAVNVLPLEEYLVGLVASEMPTDWPLEAIKAQAVAARSYALYQKGAKAPLTGHIYDVDSNVLDQVYNGASDNERVKAAVRSTKGEVLTRHGKPIKAFFNSTCGGQTESSFNVWGEKGLTTHITDPYCARSPHLKWHYSISRRALAAILTKRGFPAEDITDISIDNREKNPRAGVVVIGTGSQTFYIQGSEFREMLGYNALKSTWFGVSIEGNNVVFEGRGFGHGVGMCQWGAKGMAEAGKGYREILAFYYPGAVLKVY